MAVEVVGLTKVYGKVRAVDSLSFKVETGRVTGFVGNNGAGKTTTIGMMLGLRRENEGRVSYDGKFLREYVNPATVVGVVTSEESFYKGLTVREFLRALAILAEVPRGRVEAVIAEVGLEEKARVAIRKLSNGMRQKLRLAAAILAEPKYFILDEPFNGLDPASARWLREFLKDYVRGGERAVLVSSHILSELAQFIDDLVIIENGKLVVADSWQRLALKHGNDNLEDVFLDLVAGVGKGEAAI
jgi:ABC-2 type transport system ATP-binding protein